ncbi:MAG: hypoxanthine phosphoribosyltransferase [Candidatus Woesearchaeota archaeon]
MNNNIEVLLSEKEIKQRVSELADELKEHYPEKIRCAVVLTGAMVFFSDLMRELNKREINVYFTPIKVSSYQGMESTGEVHFELQPSSDFIIKDKSIVLIEDIVDTGYTGNFLKNYFTSQGAKEVKMCTLLDKPSKRAPGYELKPDYVGFRIEDKFVIGYGLDFNQGYRDLPFVGFFKKSPL